MGRHTTSTSYVTPYNTAGTEQPEAPGADANVNGRGVRTLTNGVTYFYPLGGQDTSVMSAHCQWDAAIIITSIAIETCNFPDGSSGVEWYDDNAGEWIDEDPTTAFVGVDGAGVTVTNGVVAAAGGAQGGCMFHFADNGARRTRLKVVVGATGGEIRVATWGKD